MLEPRALLRVQGAERMAQTFGRRCRPKPWATACVAFCGVQGQQKSEVRHRRHPDRMCRTIPELRAFGAGDL